MIVPPRAVRLGWQVAANPEALGCWAKVEAPGAKRLLEEATLVQTSRSTGTSVKAGNAIDPKITIVAMNLIDFLAAERVELDDVLAATTTNWRHRSPS